MAGSLVKVIVGAILIIVSVWWIWQGSSSSISRSGVGDLVTVLNGSVPLFVILIGLLIVWLEWDSLKMEKKS